MVKYTQHKIHHITLFKCKFGWVTFTLFHDGSQNFFISQNWKSIPIKQTTHHFPLPPGPGNHCSAFCFYESIVFFFCELQETLLHIFRLAYNIQYYVTFRCSTQWFGICLHYAVITISLVSTCFHTKLFRYYWPYSSCCTTSLWLTL